MRAGITLVAVFMLTMFSLSAFSSITIFISKEEFASAFKNEAEVYGVQDIDIEPLIPYVAGIGILFSLIYLLTGIGILMRNEIFRKIAIAIGALHGIYALLSVYVPLIAGINFAIAVILIFYLTREDVKSEFVKNLSIEERILGENWEGKIN